MTFKRALLTLCVFAATLTVFAASAFDGQWSGEIRGPEGSQMILLFLKTQGVKVTGTLVVGNEQETQIQEGVLEGNTRNIVKFKTNDTANVEALWTGRLKWGNTKTSDEIALVREAGPQTERIEVTVKRVQ